MKPLIILGANGQLGRAFVQLLQLRDLPFIALTRTEADLSRPETLTLPLHEARALINCAAYTHVDGAEKDEELATTINGRAVGTLAKACSEANVPLIHFSTDYVFSGKASTPLATDAKRAPLNAYGRSKAVGEELLEASSARHLLIRTSWVYASWGTNFVQTMARLMGEKSELRVVHDQRGCPTHVLTLAERTLSLLSLAEKNSELWGTYHITDSGECSWFEFAKAIQETLKSPCKVLSCTTEEFPRPAQRPAYGVLSSKKADELLGAAPSFQSRLAEIFA